MGAETTKSCLSSRLDASSLREERMNEPQVAHSRLFVARVSACMAMLGFFTTTLGCGAEETKGTGGSGGSAVVTFQKSECGTCVKASCGAALADCQSDPACASYLDCLYACPVDAKGNADPACDAACAPAQSSSESIKKRQAVAACRFYGDGAACPTCSVPTNLTSATLNQQCVARPNPPTPCRDCFWKHCCDTWDACFDGQNADCDALTDCVGACSNVVPIEPCLQACHDAHPASVATLLAQQTCAISQCASDFVDPVTKKPTCDLALRDACTTCVQVTCGDPFAALLSTGPGFLTYACFEDCSTAGKGADCIAGCVASHPEAADAFFLWGSCVDYRCATEC